MLIIKHRRACGPSELIKLHFTTVLIYVMVFVVGVQDVIIAKERGLTYSITVTGTMDVDRLLRHTQSKLGRKVEAFAPPPKPAHPPPAQQAKKIDPNKESDGKKKDKEKAEAADSKTTDKKGPAAATPAAKAEVKTAKEVQAEPRKADGGGEVGDDIEKKRFGEYMEGYLGYHVYSVPPPQQFSDENPNACFVM